MARPHPPIPIDTIRMGIHIRPVLPNTSIRLPEERMTTTIERDGPVTTIVRARTQTRNAMDPASAEALVEALLAFDRDPDQFVAVLWGAGGAFCAGFDLKYAASQLGKVQPLADLDFPPHGPPPRGPVG